MDSHTIFDSFSFSGKSLNCYGLAIVKESLSKRGILVRGGVDCNSNVPILVSLYWPEQLFDFIKWRFDGRLKNRTVIVGGNYPTTSPQAVLPFCEYVFLGDGEEWDGCLDSEHVLSKDTIVPKNKATATNILPIRFEDLQDTRRTFVEMSRGCRNKCLFCQYGWLKPYREADIVDIEAVLSLSKTKSVRVFAADRFQHSQYLKIRTVLDSAGKNDTGSDVSIRFLLRNPDYLKLTNKVRVGIEGASYRLRRMIGKNYTNDDIVRFCRLVSDSGIKSLDWYMIYGLPTERDGDYEEFKSLLRSVRDVMPDGYTIAIHWNAFTPSAMTPLQWSAPAKGEFNALKEIFELRIDGIKIFHKPRTTGEWTIIKRMLAIRGDSSIDRLLFSIAQNEAKFKRNINYVLKEYETGTGMGLLSEWPYDTPMPWDGHVLYRRDLMRRVSKESITKALNYER